MLKWIIGILVVTLLIKRGAVPSSITIAVSAPPEGNIDSWGNLGSRSVSPVDGGSFYLNSDGTPTNNSQRTPVPPVRTVPSIQNFRTRGYYNDSRYSIPGRN